MVLSAEECRGQSFPASSGTEFFLALPSVAQAQAPQLRIVITAAQATPVDVTFLHLNNVDSRFLSTGETWEIVVPSALITVEDGTERRSGRAMRISSLNPVTVHAYHDAFHFADGWSLPPVSSLGVDYRIASVRSPNTNGGVVVAIATEDDTELRITPSVATSSGNSAGFTYGRTLQRGEVYQITSLNPRETDMSGTRLEANKPIVVIGGHRGAAIINDVDATNPLIEAYLPVTDWGIEFYAVPPPLRDTGYYKIVARESNTIIRINGLDVGTLNAGEYRSDTIVGPVSVTASSPILFTEFTRKQWQVDTGTNGDPSMTNINPLHLWDTLYLWSTPELAPRPDGMPTTLPEDSVRFAHFLTVTAPNDPLLSVTLDGTDVSGELTILHRDGNNRSGTVMISPGSHRLASNQPINATAFGYSLADAYSLPVGSALLPPLRSLGFSTTTCNALFDTAITVYNGSRDSVVLSTISLEGLNGVVSSPSTPVTVPPYSSILIELRLNQLAFGKNEGTLHLIPSRPDQPRTSAPIMIVRDSLALTVLGGTAVNVGTLSNSLPSKDTTISIVNSGDSPIEILELNLSFPFSVSDFGLPKTLSVGDTLKLTVTFEPQDNGTYKEEGIIRTGPCNLNFLLSLEGRRTAPGNLDAVVDSDIRLVCPDEEFEDIPVKLYNRGEESIEIEDVQIVGVAAGDFTLVTSPIGVTIAPADSTEFTIRFAPGDVGDRIATLSIQHSGPTTPLETRLSARKDSVGVSTRDSVINFGNHDGCASPTRRTTYLYNLGNTAITVDSIQLSQGSFSTTISTPTVLLEGDSLELELLFSASSNGLHLDTLYVYSSPCSVGAIIPLSGNGTLPDLTASVDTLDFGLIPSCDSSQRREVVLKNTGNTVDSILSVTSSSSSFSVDPLLDSILQPDEEIRVPIHFEPNGTGTYLEEITFKGGPCEIERTVIVKGTVYSVTIAPIPDVDFGLIGSTGASVRNALIRNTSPSSVMVDNVIFDPPIAGLTITSPTFPTTIPVGDSVEVTIEYASDTPRTFSTDARVVVSQPCIVEERFLVEGELEGLSLQLILPFAEAHVDYSVDLPIRVIGGENYNEEVSIDAELRWEYRNLLPQTITTPIPGGSFIDFDHRIENDQRIVSFRYRGQLPEDEILGSISAHTLLGISDSTPLFVASVDANNATTFDPIAITGVDGLFRTLGICRVDGDRFVRLSERLNADKPLPNPAGSTIRLSINPTSSGNLRIQLYDLLGNSVQIRNARVKEGFQSIFVDVSTLPSGQYVLELEFLENIYQERVIINH